MSCSDSNEDDDDFFDGCFSIATRAKENGASADYSDEYDKTNERITFSAIRTLQAAYRGNCYSVHYLDLTDDEYMQLRDVNLNSVTLIVERCHIIIDENIFGIKRLDVSAPPNDPISHQTNTERIYFSKCEPLVAKCEGNFFFVHENLKREYEWLLQSTNKPMGTSIRVKKNRMIINRTENVLNILNSDIPFCATQTLDVLTPDANKKNCDDDEYALAPGNLTELWQRYIVNQDNELVVVERDLIYNEHIEEIFAVYDLIKQRSIAAEVEHHKEQMIGVAVSADDSNSDTSSSSPESETIPLLKMIKLPAYEVSDKVRQLIRGPRNSETDALSEEIRVHMRNKTLLSKTMRDEYTDIVNNMLDVEDETVAVFTEKFNQPNIKLTKFLQHVVYFEIEKQHAELTAAIEEKYVDYVKLTVETQSKRKKSYDGQIQRKFNGKIYIRIFEYENFGALNTKHTYFLHCLSNRVPFQVTKFSQSMCARDKLIPILLYNPKYYRREKWEPSKDKKLLQGALARNLNREQKSVVANILQRCSHPLPFILFGPPGTGKTRTLVAAIEEIVKTTDQYVLVCATSNSACDEITERLLDAIESEQMFRMFAFSIPSEKVSPRIRRVSNLSKGKHHYPALKILYRYRVIITTLCTSSCFARAAVDVEVYDPKHFSYIFIDECSAAPEVLTLVPIAGVCTTMETIQAQIVLAGDPRQLGPVVRDRRSSGLGYGISYIDRLMKCELYKVDANSGKFNEKYIVQLVKNYRSHEAILKIPNELFYGGKLVAKANNSITQNFIGNILLPNKNFPIIFHSILGECKVLPGECSSYNDAEVDQVLCYVKKLLPNSAYQKPNNGHKLVAEDIGIVAPYRKQCQMIRDRLKNLGFEEIVVGSAEVFQGKEKPVIIVSTVRSGGADLGFVADKRRLNVMITRAKCLLIIVGNPFTLKLDKNWCKMINYCDKSKAIIHNNLKFTL